MLTEADVIGGSGRPEAPALPPLSPFEELNGRGLAAIHRWHLRNVAAIAALMGDIRADLMAPGALAPAVRGMPMAQNLALFGTACGQECRALTTHHMIEDQSLFPELEDRAGAPWLPVLARLRAEHLVIHDAIEALAAAADRLAADPVPEAFDACAEAFSRLEAVVRSHFRWEETRIGPAIGHFGLQV